MIMKNKIWIFIGAIIVIATLLGAFMFLNKTKNNNEATNLIYIGVNDLAEKIANKEDFILVMSQTGCSHCEQYLPELNRTLKEVNYKAFVINITNLNEEDTNKLNKYVHFSGTPTTIFYKEGEETTTLNRISGYTSKTKIIERLKSLGYIN